MRIAGIGLLMLGTLIAVAAIVAEDAGAALLAITAGGFIFVAGAVFAASAGIQDAISRK